MRQLRVTETDHMAPRAEGPCLLLHACLSGQVRDPMGWNIVAELTENCEFRRGWKFGFFHDLSCDRSSSGFQPFSFFLWDGCVNNLILAACLRPSFRLSCF